MTEQLSVEENRVNLDSKINNDLGADSLDAIELGAIEEFDIEIAEKATELITTVGKAVDYYIYYKLSA